MNNKDLPAFPVECTYTEDGKIKGTQTSNATGFEMGLSKREYVAAMAMQGLLAQHAPGPYNTAAIEITCITAVQIADGLLLELEKQPVP